MLRNSLAHLIARIAALAAGIATIPLITLTLGTEALGLVGVYATLVAMLGLFDLGLPVAANYRLAVLIGRDAAPAEKAELVRTLEILFWGLVALFLIVGFGLRRPLALSWLNVGVMPLEAVDAALAVIIAAVAVRFPVAFYTNVLFAHDRHVYPNAVTGVSTILRILIGAVALAWFNIGIVGFFLVHLIGSIAEVALLVGGVWYAQPQRWAVPRWAILRDVGAMAGGLTLISLTAVVFSQIDKIILSKVLSLGNFGLYSAGYTIAAGLVALSYPVGNAIFPQLSRALDAASVDTKRIVQAATELTILILVPLGCVMVMQTEPLLRLLFLVKPLPATLANVLPLMMVGAIAQGFVTLPHLFQVAAGRVSMVVWINTGLLVPYGAGILFATVKGGVLGAATAFAVFNFARLLVHWGLLIANHRTRSVWRQAIALTLASVTAGLFLAGVPTMIGISDPGATIVAVLSVPALATVAVLIMPHARERLFALYRESLGGGGAKA